MKPAEQDGAAGPGHVAAILRRARAGPWWPAHSWAARASPSNPQAFRILIFGSSISMLGTRISTLAFPMLVLGIKNSPLIAGFVAFAAIAPGVLFYMPVGAIVDRRDPRRIMLVSEISRGIVAILVVVALLLFGRNINIAFLMLAMLAEEVLEIFSTLADRRYLNRLIERDKIGSQQASVEVRTHAAALAGRPIGPLLFAFGAFVPFLVDAISFIASVVSLLLARRTEEQAEEYWETEWPTLRELTSGIGQGVAKVKSDRRIWLPSSLMSMTSVVSQALILIFLVEAHSRKLSALEIGIVLGASGVGGALGSFCSKFVLKFIRGRWLPVQMGAWFIVFALLAITRGSSAFWNAIAMFIMSVTGAIGNIECRTYLTENVADDMIGKISGVSCTLTIGACALGPVFGGYVVQKYSVHVAVFILFIIVTSMALASLLVFKKSPPQAGVVAESGPSPAECLPAKGMQLPGPSPFEIASWIGMTPTEEPASGIVSYSCPAGFLLGNNQSTMVDYSQIVSYLRKRSHSILIAGDLAVRPGLASQILEESGGFRKDWNPSRPGRLRLLLRGAARESSWNVVGTASHSALSMTSINCVNVLASRATPPWNG